VTSPIPQPISSLNRRQIYPDGGGPWPKGVALSHSQMAEDFFLVFFFFFEKIYIFLFLL
jgi:hypothetical protein